MSYGNYGRYGSSYSGRSSSYIPSSYYRKSYISPSSFGSLKTIERSEYELKPSKSDSSMFEFQSERSRQRYGSSSSIPDTASEGSSRNDVPSDFSSRSSLNDEENKEYKKLYEETKKENEQLKEALKKTEEDLEKTKKQLQRMPQNNSFVSSLSETEKKERRSLERKISEMEEEIKQIEKLKADNERLNNENKALIRVISKLSK